MPKTFEFIKSTGIKFRAQNDWHIWFEKQKSSSRWKVEWTALKNDRFSILAAKARGYYFGHVMRRVKASYPHNNEDTIHLQMKCLFAWHRDPHTGFYIVKPVLSDDSDLSIEERWEFIDQVRDYWLHPPSQFQWPVVTNDPDPQWRIDEL